MALSYALRLACLVAVGTGLLQTVLEIAFWLAGPSLLRLMRRLRLRQQERALYAIQVLPFLLAVLLTGLCWVPRYLSTETNFAPEQVGWLCLLLAVSVTVRWGAGAAAGTRMAIRTARFGRTLMQSSSTIPGVAGRLPLVAVSGAAPRVVLVGLLRPFILISRTLIETGGLDAIALDLVLEHERSHATQLDNWKLLSLRCLPHLPLRVSGKTWMQLWQSATERAADEDATRGSAERALRLAETLVALARSGSTANTHLAWTHFICAGTELASRVEQLTRSRHDAAGTHHPDLGFRMRYRPAGWRARLGAPRATAGGRSGVSAAPGLGPSALV